MPLSDQERVKVFFKLERDDDGYPPDDWESLWAERVNENRYSIDNIPFFVRDLSVGDIVEARLDKGILRFSRIAKRSKNSVLRVIAYDEIEISSLRRNLLAFGCDSEQSHVPNLISVNIPADVNLEEVIVFLDEGESSGRWEYETASIRS